MAKLYFYHAAMDAGKTARLLQTWHNYQQRNMQTRCFTSVVVTKEPIIQSRTGLKGTATCFDPSFDFLSHTQHIIDRGTPLHCLLVDEAQFLTKQQVEQLVHIVDYLDIPVLTYGLRSDFQGEPFEGSRYLLAWADELYEIKTMCHCGRKAIMNMRINPQGGKISFGPQVQAGGNESYISTCRKHHKEGKANADAAPDAAITADAA